MVVMTTATITSLMPVHPRRLFGIGAMPIRVTTLRYPNARFRGDKLFNNQVGKRNVDVQWGTINIVDLPVMDFRGEDLKRYALRVGDLLVCEGGEVGRAAVWKGELETCFYQKALHRLRPRNCRTDDPQFLFYSILAAAKGGIFS